MTMTRLTDGNMVAEVELDDPEMQELLNKQVRQTEAILGDLREKFSEIEASEELTDKGKRKQKQRALEEVQPALRHAMQLPEVERLTNRVRDKRKNLYEVSERLSIDEVDPEKRDDVRAIERETRQLLRERLEEPDGDLDVFNMAMEAAANDDKVTLRAIENAPSTFAILPDSKLQKVRERHVQEVYPDHAADVEAKARALSYLRFNAKQAQDTLRGFTGTTVVDSPSLHVVEDGEMRPYEPDAGEAGGRGRRHGRDGRRRRRGRRIDGLRRTAITETRTPERETTMAQRKGVRFNNSNRLLVTDDDRLSELRSRVDQLASDLAELEAMDVSERREAADLRSRVLQTFKTIGRV